MQLIITDIVLEIIRLDLENIEVLTTDHENIVAVNAGTEPTLFYAPALLGVLKACEPDIDLDILWARMLSAAVPLQVCGHPISYIQWSDEGTDFCMACAREAGHAV